MIALFCRRRPTPIGDLLIVQDGAGLLHGIEWEDRRPRLLGLLQRYAGGATLVEAGDATLATAAIAEYFCGHLAAIAGVPTAVFGTPFQRLLWSALRDIPPSATTSYAALAARIGRPAAIRAVGAANGANPVSLVVPCHRVLGAGGALTGYGGGLPRKAWLLAHEAAHGNRSAPPGVDGHTHP